MATASELAALIGLAGALALLVAWVLLTARG
jgi:hypothetical protein